MNELLSRLSNAATPMQSSASTVSGKFRYLMKIIMSLKKKALSKLFRKTSKQSHYVYFLILFTYCRRAISFFGPTIFNIIVNSIFFSCRCSKFEYQWYSYIRIQVIRIGIDCNKFTLCPVPRISCNNICE